MKNGALPKWQCCVGTEQLWHDSTDKTAVDERHPNFKALFACLIVAVLKAGHIRTQGLWSPAKYDSLFMKYILTLPFLHRGPFATHMYSSKQLNRSMNSAFTSGCDALRERNSSLGASGQLRKSVQLSLRLQAYPPSQDNQHHMNKQYTLVLCLFCSDV